MPWRLWPFPTCVGMNRHEHEKKLYRLAVPHMRGDEPLKFMACYMHDARSPHAWG